MKTIMKSSKKQTKGRGVKTSSPRIEPIESGCNNNIDKDIILMESIMENFSDIEIKFMCKQLNLHNAMGSHITKSELKTLPIRFILKFINNAKVAEFGSLLKNIISIKLLNKIQ